jgi:uncharacterized membrane protein
MKRDQMSKWYSFKPIGYFGLVLTLAGLLVPKLCNIDNALFEYAGTVLFIIGIYLMFKGREQHGL